MRNLVFCFFLIGCSFFVFGQNGFVLAEDLFSQKKYEQAKTQYQSLLKKGFQNQIIYRRLGDIEALQKRYKAASGYYQKLLTYNSQNADYHFLYGGTLALHAQQTSKLDALGYIDDIKSHLKKAVQLDVTHVEARWAMVQLYCELPGILGGSFKTSRLYANQLLELSPVDGYLALGYIAEYEKEYEKAIAYYKKAVLTGGSITTYQKLASLYENKTNEYLKAIVVLQEAYSIYQTEELLDEINRIKWQYDLLGD